MSINPPHVTIIGISETWLNNTNERLYTLDGYHTIPASRVTGSGGGVALFVPSNINFTTRPDLGAIFHDTNTAECIAVELTLSENSS